MSCRTAAQPIFLSRCCPARLIAVSLVVMAPHFVCCARQRVPTVAAAVSPASLDRETLTGKTAFEALCGFWTDRTRSIQYFKEGCSQDCAVLTIDCNSGPGDGFIELTYARHSYSVFTKESAFGLYKHHRSFNGRYLIFPMVDHLLIQAGCYEWMQAPLSWCEAPKLTKNEDAEGFLRGKVLPGSSGVEWDLVYHWLHFSEAAGVWTLEEDRVKGKRHADSIVVAGLKSSGFGSEMELPTGDSFTVGVSGWSRDCEDNDRPKGEGLPLVKDVTCATSVIKSIPSTGQIVKSVWETTHFATDVKKRFSV